MGRPFKEVDEQIKEHFADNYKGETDISKVLDLSRLKDDIDGLMEEMLKQPSVYAYWANLRRIAEDNFDTVSNKFEILKSRKRKEAIEKLAIDGNNKPSLKSIETKLKEITMNDDNFKKFDETYKLWKQRKEQLTIIEKAVSLRDNSFRSLSYLLSSMMKGGIYVTKNEPSKLKRVQE